MKKYKIVEVNKYPGIFNCETRRKGVVSITQENVRVHEECGFSGMLRRVMGLRDAGFWKA
jgi:hypothetical protein